MWLKRYIFLRFLGEYLWEGEVRKDVFQISTSDSKFLKKQNKTKKKEKKIRTLPGNGWVLPKKFRIRNCRSDLFRTGFGRCEQCTMLCLRHCRTESHTQQKFSWSWNSGLARAGEGGESWHLPLISEEPGEPSTDWVMLAPPALILEIRRALAQQFKACRSAFERQ